MSCVDVVGVRRPTCKYVQRAVNWNLGSGQTCMLVALWSEPIIEPCGHGNLSYVIRN